VGKLFLAEIQPASELARVPGHFLPCPSGSPEETGAQDVHVERTRMLFTPVQIRDREHFHWLLSEPRRKMFPEAILKEHWPDNHAPDVPVAGFSGSGKKTETGTMEAMPFNATCQFV